MLGLYLHVPFCSSICNYCNFNRGLLETGLKDRYVRALEGEIRQSGRGERVDTIFFGGERRRSSNRKRSAESSRPAVRRSTSRRAPR